MEVVSDELERIDDLIAQMVGHAWLACTYRDKGRREPALAAGLGRLADKHGAAATALGDEIRGATAALMGMGVTVAPSTVGRRGQRR